MAQARLNGSLRHRDGLYEQILGSLSQMPPDLRELFILSHYEGKPLRELAAALSIEPGDLARKLAKANALFFRNLRGGGEP